MPFSNLSLGLLETATSSRRNIFSKPGGIFVSFLYALCLWFAPFEILTSRLFLRSRHPNQFAFVNWIFFFSKRHCVYLAQSMFQTERSNYRFEITTIRHHENNAPRFINGIRFSPVGKRGADAFIRPKGSRHGSPTTFTEPRFLLYN